MCVHPQPLLSAKQGKVCLTDRAALRVTGDEVEKVLEHYVAHHKSLGPAFALTWLLGPTFCPEVTPKPPSPHTAQAGLAEHLRACSFLDEKIEA